jgi:hypothetical protein
MPETLLRTKLFIPPLRPKLVPRPRLIERLNQGIAQGCKLTLVSTPAGFGKSTLVKSWLIETDSEAAWLSLDQGDNDPVRFWTYVVAARRCPGQGREALLVVRKLPVPQATRPPHVVQPPRPSLSIPSPNQNCHYRIVIDITSLGRLQRYRPEGGIRRQSSCCLYPTQFHCAVYIPWKKEKTPPVSTDGV